MPFPPSALLAANALPDGISVAVFFAPPASDGGSEDGSRMVETASAVNLKPVWADQGRLRDWRDPRFGQGHEYLRRATQVKTIWLPYGE